MVTETRTGPLGCSNYDNLDSVSSVLVQSPENKIHLQGWPSIIELSPISDGIVTESIRWQVYNYSVRVSEQIQVQSLFLFSPSACLQSFEVNPKRQKSRTKEAQLWSQHETE
ncbi:hypothetical protein CHARACLAT_023358 [Characodon lateralis]|uniref:Uncharacterized protein n=1 Tax=Characodon lateralis TaxID=208331 RepID=A0ABU7DBA0_9TELE|nr:hypothetical protein [Characodon lateralis]